VTFSSTGSKSISSDSSSVKKESLSENIHDIIALKVYPNPFIDLLTIKIDSPDDKIFDLSIFDMSGRLVFTKTKIPGNTENTYNLSLTHGTYLLVVKDKERKMIHYIVKY
jgi:hypothetical protein